LAAIAFVAAATAPLSTAQAVPKPGDNASLEEQRRYFTEDDVAPMVKPANYDVTIVEYMDYQCPNCRASHEPMKQLLAKDKKLRVIYRDWPIFGAKSEAAAMVAIAANYQGKHSEVHDALMEAPLPLDEKKIEAAVKKAGADMTRIDKDLKDHSKEILELIQRNDDQAQSIGMQGTPGFLIGNVQFFGGMSLKELEKAVAEARKAPKAGGAKAK
jgi:protein-disulfide isomerase